MDRPWNLEAEGWGIEVEVEVVSYPVVGQTLDDLDRSFEEVEQELASEFGVPGQAYLESKRTWEGRVRQGSICIVEHFAASVRFRFHLPVPGPGLPSYLHAIAEARCRASREHEQVHAEIVMGQVVSAVLEATAATAEDCDALRALLKESMSRSRQEQARLNTLFDAEVRRRRAAESATSDSIPGKVDE